MQTVYANLTEIKNAIDKQVLEELLTDFIVEEFETKFGMVYFCLGKSDVVLIVVRDNFATVDAHGPNSEKLIQKISSYCDPTFVSTKKEVREPEHELCT